MPRKSPHPQAAPAAELWLVRHAHALDGAADAERPLSSKGRAQVKRLGAFLRKNRTFGPDELWHSGLVRAKETAELLAQRMKLRAPRRAVAGLKPEDDPRAIRRRLAQTKRAIALVGHEPHLSALASLLVAGEAEPPVFEMKKCAVLALGRVTGRWFVRWQISPEVIP